MINNNTISLSLCMYSLPKSCISHTQLQAELVTRDTRIKDLNLQLRGAEVRARQLEEEKKRILEVIYIPCLKMRVGIIPTGSIPGFLTHD